MTESIDRETLQDQHLDMMIRFAFLRDEQEEIERMLITPDPVLSADEEAAAKEAFKRASILADEQEKREKGASARRVFRRVAPRVIQIAACFILLAALALPVAFASSAAFRSRVLQMLMEWNEERTMVHFWMQENEDVAFFVPDGYPGEYYLAYIPEGFEVWEIDPDFGEVTLLYGDQQIAYGEAGPNIEEWKGAEGSDVVSITVNGMPGYMIEGNSRLTGSYVVDLAWAADDRWFSLTTWNVGKEETIRIAESIRKIIR